MTTTLARFISALRTDSVTLIADEGRVACPRSRHDVDVDWCFTCPSFEGPTEDGNGNILVRCRTVRRR
jgi:hypothetical protein